MPPVHPALVHYPIALVSLSVIADLFGYLTDSPSLQAAGTLALLGAGAGAAIAVIAGLFDMKRAKMKHAAHERVHVHMKVGFVLFAALAGLTIWRWVVSLDPHHGLGWSYLIPGVGRARAYFLSRLARRRTGVYGWGWCRSHGAGHGICD